MQPTAAICQPAEPTADHGDHRTERERRSANGLLILNLKRSPENGFYGFPTPA